MTESGSHPQTRRRVLELALAANAAGIAEAWQHAAGTHREGARRATDRLEFFTKDEAAEIEALAALIIPSSDGNPGAREAGVVYFADRALATFDRDQQRVYREGLAALRARVGGPLAALPLERQLDVARAIEQTAFFEAVRVHTIVGFLAPPSYGGNRGQAGWTLIGFQE